ncbi:MAG: hydroxysqualene dehydroxylase HpnE [Candidatus Kapaibacterium sp.]
MKKIGIIGAGAAGLAAAVHLAQSGVKPIVIEASPSPGGRARSRTAALGETIDNGQHLMIGAYESFIKLLEITGERDSYVALPPFRMDFRRSTNRYRLDTSPFSGRIGAAWAMLRFGALDIQSKLRLAAFVAQIISGRIDAANLTAGDVLRKYGQTPLAIGTFWEPLIVATMNSPIDRASGRLFMNIVRIAFFGRPEDGRLLLPSKSSGEIFAHAERFITSRGGEVYYTKRVSNFEKIDSGFRLICRDNMNFDCDGVISAVPPASLKPILPPGGDFGALAGFCEELEYSPIVSIYIWSRRRLDLPPMTALLDSPLQWIFARDEFISGYSSNGDAHRYAITISAADAIMPMKRNEIIEFTIHELSSFFPDFSENDLINFEIIKEGLATPLFTPEMESRRPENATSMPGMFVAGDWTATGLPATLESAARSGFAAAKKCLEFVNH